MSPTPGNQETLRNFRSAVNMSAAALRCWFETDESNSVGMAPGGEGVTAPAHTESVGHHMGQRILQFKQCPLAHVTPADYADTRKMIGYVRRHVAQRPAGDIKGSRWRKSLMN